MSVREIKNEKDETVMVELKPGDHDPEMLAQGGKDAIDIVTASALQPIGGLTMTPEEYRLHRRVNLKLDLLVLPLITFMYLFNGLDRSNVGNAATVSFYEDLNTDSTSVNNAVTLFYCTFVTCMTPSTYIGKRVGGSRWLPIMMLGWGLFTLANAFAKSETQLVVFRLLVGMCEAGYYPTSAYYFASNYVRFDLAFRLGIFYGSYAIAGAFSGVISYGVLQIQSSLHAWQYLFIIEGAATMGLAVFAWFWLPTHIGNAWFLTPEEKAWAVERIARDSGGEDYQKKGISRNDMKIAFKDWKLWTILFIGTLSGVQQSAFGVFLPLIVQQLGYVSFYANLYSVPIYVVGAAGLWILSFSSDHFKDRLYHYYFAMFTVILGLALLVSLTDPRARYAAMCILQIGNFVTSPLMASLLVNNSPNPGHRAIALSVNGWGNVGGIIGGQLFRQQFAPGYLIPFYVSLALCVVGTAAAVWLRFRLVQLNKWRAKKVASMTPEEIEEENLSDVRQSDKKWTYQYSL